MRRKSLISNPSLSGDVVACPIYQDVCTFFYKRTPWTHNDRVRGCMWTVFECFGDLDTKHSSVQEKNITSWTNNTILRTSMVWI